MNLRVDLHILGWLLVLLGLFQSVAVMAALAFGEPPLAYAASAVLSGGSGTVLALATRGSGWRLRPRDGFLVVGGGWIVASLFGAVPYVTTATLGPVDALFESVSGFTTTGSTVMTNIEAAPGALLLWRSLTQWVGGMGIILFTVAILPLLGIGGMQLFRAEVPGPVADKIRPRIVETARALWKVYVGLTAAEWIALRLAGVGSFDALCHSLTTMATGGFSTRGASVGAFGSPVVEWIVTGFMLLAGMNFVLHYRLLTGRATEVWRDGELRYFLIVVGSAVTAVTVALLRIGSPFGEALRHAAFQTVSILTTTGYVTTNFELWPHVANFLLLVLMVLGGMSGSTGGGVKSLRALLGLRSLRVSLDRFIHRHAVRPVKYGGQPVAEEVLAGMWAFFTAYFAIAAVGALVVTAAGYDLVTAAAAALTTIGNVGPGLGEVGAYDNFAHFPALVKLTLSFCMLAGRLEIFTLLVLFFPEFWRR